MSRGQWDNSSTVKHYQLSEHVQVMHFFMLGIQIHLPKNSLSMFNIGQKPHEERLLVDKQNINYCVSTFSWGDLKVYFLFCAVAGPVIVGWKNPTVKNRGGVISNCQDTRTQKPPGSLTLKLRHLGCKDIYALVMQHISVLLLTFWMSAASWIL